MEESVKSRTIEFVKAKGIKMKVFEERCGLSSGYVTSMRKGFGPDKLNGVLKAFPELNRNWLLYGEGKMLADDETVANTDAMPEYDIDFSGTFIFVSRTCKSARLVLSVTHNRGVSAPSATSRYG